MLEDEKRRRGKSGWEEKKWKKRIAREEESASALFKGEGVKRKA